MTNKKASEPGKVSITDNLDLPSESISKGKVSSDEQDIINRIMNNKFKKSENSNEGGKKD